MRYRAALLAAGAAVAFLACPWAAPAAPEVRPPKGSPDPKLMILRAGDFAGGAEVEDEGYYVDTSLPAVISYARSFAEPSVGGKELIGADADVSVARTANVVAAAYRDTVRLFGTPGGRAELRQAIVDSFVEEVGEEPDFVRVGGFRRLKAGDGAVQVTIKVGIPLGTITFVDVVVHAERVIAYLSFLNVGSVPRAGVLKLTKLTGTRMLEGLLPASVRPPTVTGPPQEGQTLTASTGTWNGAPTSFAYQWLRCNTAGERCSAIAGAKGKTYVPVAADVGSTLRVSVTAKNGSGGVAARSAATAVVAAKPGPPVNTALPTIVGSARVGQTLGVTIGAWNGSPNTFAYQWLRCDPAGAACVAIQGAVGQSYFVTGEDLGSTIGVTVTAGNALGTTAANAQPTAVVTT